MGREKISPIVLASGLQFLVGCSLLTEPAPTTGAPGTATSGRDGYADAIEKTADMNSRWIARTMARRHGLRILDVVWEDTARFSDSSVGPNISDLTIQVAHQPAGSDELEVTAMPVIRFPNFSDKTADLDPRDFTLLVGNHDGDELKRVSLHAFLEDPRRFLSEPGSWAGTAEKTLLAERDSQVLVSAQACFLPVPKQGKATFNPVLFNYQSYEKNPAVLTILATREGTSVTVIDNQRDAFSVGSAWGQRLFHNADGQRASLTGTRESEFELPPGDPAGPAVETAPDTTGMNLVLLIQVPLKYEPKSYDFGAKSALPVFSEEAPPSPLLSGAFSWSSDVEAAVIGHGELEGPFTEIDDLPIERDPRYPVRVTVQFYKATSNGVLAPRDLRQIKREIRQIYDSGTAVGSLVTGGRSGRVTEYEGSKVQPPGWWDDFWKRHEANTGDSPADAQAKLAMILGEDYRSQAVCDLYLRDLLRQ